MATIIYVGTNTSIVLADSKETLAAYSQAGIFKMDGIGVAGYYPSTTTNEIDSISVDFTSVLEPLSTALLGLGGLALLLRRKN